MSLILHIDTATENAIVGISRHGKMLHFLQHESQKDHAAFLHIAVQQLMQKAELSLHDLEAVAVTGGPGSYTGLRVGMASAKGFCYALHIPLIICNTLEILTASAIYQMSFRSDLNDIKFCPMIDARRMEVFTAVYNSVMVNIMEPTALILEPESFVEILLQGKIIFFGSGASKWKNICRHPNAIFENISFQPDAIAKFTQEKFLQSHFTEPAYCEPLYLKEFQSVINK
jgi:tRNA threonylcarbamoyladenosine biosynthesis protein TsaB